MNYTYYEQTAVLYLDDAPLIPDNSEMTQQISVRPAQAVPMNIVRGTPPGIDWRLVRQTAASLLLLGTMIFLMPLIARLFASHTPGAIRVSKNIAATNLFEYTVRSQPAASRMSHSISLNAYRRPHRQVFTVNPGAPMPEDGSF